MEFRGGYLRGWDVKGTEAVMIRDVGVTVGITVGVTVAVTVGVTVGVTEGAMALQ